MATLTLYSSGYDISDQVFTFELDDIEQIKIFVGLVKHGGVKAGLVNPAVKIVSKGHEQSVSKNINDWQLDLKEL